METVRTDGKREELQTTQPRGHLVRTFHHNCSRTFVAEHFTTTLTEHMHKKHGKALAAGQREKNEKVGVSAVGLPRGAAKNKTLENRIEHFEVQVV